MRLLEAVLAENVVEANELLSKNVDVNFSYEEYSGNMTLHLAICTKIGILN